jgi:hypothetical protein
MRLIDNWQRTLTHGYSAWCVYASIILQFLYDNLTWFSEIIPGWASIGILGSALILRIIKQDVVSGGDDEPA